MHASLSKYIKIMRSLARKLWPTYPRSIASIHSSTAFNTRPFFLWVELQPLMLLFFICFDEIYLYPILLVILVSTNIPVLAPRGLESHRRDAAPCLSKLRDEQGPAKQGCQAGIPAKWFIFFHFMVPFSATLIVNLHVWMNPSF